MNTKSKYIVLCREHLGHKYWQLWINDLRNNCNVMNIDILYNHSVNECPVYDSKQSKVEVSVMLELWGMRSTPSLPFLPEPLWPGVVAPDRILSLSQIELNYLFTINWIDWNRTGLTNKLRTYAKLKCLKWNSFRHWNCTYAMLNCLK